MGESRKRNDDDAEGVAGMDAERKFFVLDPRLLPRSNETKGKRGKFVLARLCG